MKRSLLTGPPIDLHHKSPSTLKDYIHKIIDYWPEGMLHETYCSNQTITTAYQQIYQNSLRICKWLKENNIENTNHIILLLDTAHEYTAAVWSCILGNYVWIPWSLSGLNKNKKKYIQNLEHLIQQFNTVYILTLPSIIDQIRDLPTEISSSAKILNLNEILNVSSAFIVPESVQQDNTESICSVIPTSGTTGIPKLVSISHKAMYYRRVTRLNRSTRRQTLNLFPFNSITGMNIAFPTCPISHYFEISLIASQPLYLLEYINKHKIENVALNSYMAALMCYSIELSKPNIDLSCVKSLAFGADAIIPEQVKNLVSHFNNLGAIDLDVSFAYGMTESSVVCYKKIRQNELFNNPDVESLPFLGTAVQGMSIRIADENSNIIPQGETGQIQLRSKQLLFSGYFNNPALTKSIFTEDGWFNTGDRGVIYDDQLKITGRKNFKTVAELDNTSVQEIEIMLQKLPGIYNSMLYVCPVKPTDNARDELVIFFVPDKSKDNHIRSVSEEIHDKNNKSIGAVIRAIVPISIDDLEVTATGKILRSDLLDKFLRFKLDSIKT